MLGQLHIKNIGIIELSTTHSCLHVAAVDENTIFLTLFSSITSNS